MCGAETGESLCPHTAARSTCEHGCHGSGYADDFQLAVTLGCARGGSMVMIRVHSGCAVPRAALQVRVGGSLLSLLGQFVIPFLSARISYVPAMYQQCISIFALSRS